MSINLRVVGRYTSYDAKYKKFDWLTLLSGWKTAFSLIHRLVYYTKKANPHRNPYTPVYFVVKKSLLNVLSTADLRAREKDRHTINLLLTRGDNSSI